ncbi:MAG: Fic family protein [Candidatus Saccharimonadales bacterium]|jgi:Fic family protein
MSDKTAITVRQQEILRLFNWAQKKSSGQLLEMLKSTISIATLKRDLTLLSDHGYIERSGSNRDSEYSLTNFGLLRRSFDIGSYYLVSDTERQAMQTFNMEIFDILKVEDLFTKKEIQKLDAATAMFKSNAINASDVIYKKELERFVIEFSWKSSKIEGNTYTLLETEKLIREGLKKSDRSDFETAMILNHKKAYEFILEQSKDTHPELSRRVLEQIHSLVVADLGIGVGLRSAAVGISGSLYRPLSLGYKIEEQLEELISCINAKSSPYEKALIAVLGESYLQPFEDGNKRTARVLANGLLLQSGHAPLSYRSVNEQDYKEACLIFYEQNSIQEFKKIFIEQYVFGAENYNISRKA